MRDIKRRIQSNQSMQQITKAMELVSAAKLRRAQGRVVSARPFANKLHEVLGRVAEVARAGVGEESLHPLLEPREVEKVLYVVIASDRGLAGGYNANIIRFAKGRLAREQREAEVIAVGRKVRDAIQKTQWGIRDSRIGLGDEVDLSETRALVADLMDLYARREVDEIQLVYSRFVSALTHEPTMSQLVPITAIDGGGEGAGGGEGGAAGEPAGAGGLDTGVSTDAGTAANEANSHAEYIYEPSPEEVMSILLPRYVENQVYQALLEAKASEHGARMTAMKNASDNATDIIRDLQLSFNRARQAGITTELTEIMGGAAALGGD